MRFIAETQDKRSKMFTLSELMILHYLREHQKITLKQAAKTIQETQELCGFNKNQTYYILHQMCKDGILQPDGVGRGTKYKSVK